MDLDLTGTRVLFVTPECAPLTKTGGLGDVSAALPAALRGEVGVDVRTLLPGYPEVMGGLSDGTPAGKPGRIVASGRDLGYDWNLRETHLPSRVPLFVLDCPPLFQRVGGPYQTGEGQDWPDNAVRFGLFSRVAALLAGERTPLAWRPDVLHCNDWPAALAPAFLRYEQAGTAQPAASGAASLVTIHNLAFQGLFEPGMVERLGLPPSSFTLEGLEFHGRMSFLKAGLSYAAAINTVSPNYAREIQTAEFGCGLDGLLRHRSGVLSGILNGIDTGEWDPAGDPRLSRRYDAGTLEFKAENKAALQKRAGLAVDAAVPLLGVVGRMTHQKGIDLIVAAAEAMVAAPAQLVVLGSGDREQEQAVAALAARHPGKVAATIGFSEELAHLIEAGADLFLMPSRFEPCGLNQMYSQRYGTPPVARACGGLADTIVDGETGFLFEGADSAALAAAVRRGIAAYRDPRRWRKIQRAGMARDFSWAEAARRYADLYLRLARLARV